jgi:hypothetical protein
VAIVIGASILMSSQVFARDVTFSCSDPPDRSARVAIAEGATVNKTQDRNEKRCSFSVNGAKADSPGAEALLEGVNSFRQGAPIVGELGKKSVDNLAYAMLATAPVSEIPKEFADFLQRNSGALADCVQGFFKGSDPNITLTSTFGNSGYCRRYEAPQYLEITITWSNGRFVSSLYVHRMAPNLPRIKR